MHWAKRNLVVVTIALLVIGAVLLVQWLPWLLLLPVAAVVVGYPLYRFRRARALRRMGYFVTSTKEHPVVYEERIGKELLVLPIPTVMIDNGCHEVVVPLRGEWERLAPEWAKHRRDEIFRRVIEAQPKGWVQLPADWPA